TYLGAKLASDDFNTSKHVMDAVGSAGLRGKPFLPLVQTALGDKDKVVRAAAVGVLGGMAEVAPENFPAVLKALKDEDKFVRDQVLWSVGTFWGGAKEALPDLLAVWDQGD